MKRRILGAILFVSALLLTLASEDYPVQSPVSIEVQKVDAVRVAPIPPLTLVSTPSLRGAPRTSQASPGGARPAAPQLAVQVVTVGDLRPLARASVALYDPPGASESEVAGSLPTLQEAAETDDGGRCVLKSYSLPAYIVARAAGFSAREIFVPQQPAEDVTISLSHGASIRGIVVDPSGSPVSGILLRASRIALPLSVRVPPKGATPGIHYVEGASKDDGTFALDGLEDAHYRVEACGPGFVDAHRTRLVKGRVVPMVVRAGAEAVRVVVQPIRVFVLRLVHGGTGEPFVPPGLVVSVTKTAGYRSVSGLEPLTVPASEGWLSCANLEHPSGLFIGYALPDSSGEAASDVPIALAAPGFQPAITIVSTALPSKLETAPVNEVRLEPTTTGGFGHVLLIMPSIVDGLYRGTRRLLLWQGGSAEALTSVNGKWDFAGVPSGRRRFRVFDGLTWGDEVEADVTEGGSTELHCAYGAVSGFSVAMHDASGSRILDPDLAIVQSVDRYEGIPGVPGLGGLVLADGASAEVVQVVPPGRYKVSIKKAGYQWAQAFVDVQSGSIASASVVLAEE